MKLFIEIELEADVNEGTDDQVTINALYLNNSTLNIMHYLSVTELDQVQQAAEEAVEKELIDKALAIRDKRDMRGDSMREIARECRQEMLSELRNQRGVQLA